MNKAEIEAEKQYNAQGDREARRLHFYVVMLKDRNDPWGEWFESDIEGTHDHCYSQVRGGSLDMHFDIQIVEAHS
jgi:hypothetical protein